MSSIDLDTPVQLTMKQILAATAILIGGTWGLLTWSTASLRDDVSVIRKSLQALQLSDKDGAVKVRDTELALTKEIASLRLAIQSLEGTVKNVGGEVSLVRKDINILQGQVSSIGTAVAALGRQQPPPR